MKFDRIIMNPPYNTKSKNGRGGGSGNAIWPVFVEAAKNLLKNDGHLILIHPDRWREPGDNSGVFRLLKDGLVELHQLQFTAFKEAEVSVDWYHYINSISAEHCDVFFPTGECEKVDLRKKDHLISVPSTDDIAVLAKTMLLDDGENDVILSKVFNDGKNVMNTSINGKFKFAYSTRWTEENGGNFQILDHPHKDQDKSKVIFCAIGKPRAKWFSETDSVGPHAEVHYILCDAERGQRIVDFLNSDDLWRLMLSVKRIDKKGKMRGGFWKKLNIPKNENK